MGTVAFVCVDKTLAQRLATPSVLQDMQPLHVKDADQLLALSNGGNTLEAVFIGPGYPEPIRLAQRVHGVHSETPILICRLPEEYDELRRALQFAPMLGDVTCTTTSDALDFELQSAISRNRQRRRMRAAITASNVALAATPRKREVALRYFDRLLEAAPIGVLALDSEFRILDSNRKAADMFSSSKEWLSGKSLSSLFSDEQWAEVQAVLNSAITSNQDLLLPAVSRMADHASQFLEIRAIQFELDVGDFGVLCILQDITERKRAEDQLAFSNEELKRVNRELEEFVFVANHDIQEPLRMVNIYTQLILRSIGPQREKVEQYASFVQQGVTRMEALIHDLLTFSRAVHADELPIGTADLSASLMEAVSVLKHAIDESGSAITAASLPTVRSDAAQMTHVFQNLLSNALKYRKKEVPLQVDIQAHRDGAYWIISVRDNGIGFEPHYAERIFGLFKRLHKDEYPGTGLGLAICKRIVERYGGRIWAEGRFGEGATFHFSLPPVEEQ